MKSVTVNAEKAGAYQHVVSIGAVKLASNAFHTNWYCPSCSFGALGSMSASYINCRIEQRTERYREHTNRDYPKTHRCLCQVYNFKRSNKMNDRLINGERVLISVEWNEKIRRKQAHCNIDYLRRVIFTTK